MILIPDHSPNRVAKHPQNDQISDTTCISMELFVVWGMRLVGKEDCTYPRSSEHRKVTNIWMSVWVDIPKVNKYHTWKTLWMPRVVPKGPQLWPSSVLNHAVHFCFAVDLEICSSSLQKWIKSNFHKLCIYIIYGGFLKNGGPTSHHGFQY